MQQDNLVSFMQQQTTTNPLQQLRGNNSSQISNPNTNMLVSNNSQQYQLQQQLVQALLQQPSLSPQQIIHIKQQFMLNQSLSNSSGTNQVSNSLLSKSPQTPLNQTNSQHSTNIQTPTNMSTGVSTPTNLSTNNVSNNSSSTTAATTPTNFMSEITSSLNNTNTSTTNTKLQESLDMIKQQHVLLMQRSNNSNQNIHHMNSNMNNNNNFIMQNSMTPQQQHHVHSTSTTNQSNNTINGNNNNILSNNMNNIFNSNSISSSTTASLVTSKNLVNSYQGTEDINNMLLNSLQNNTNMVIHQQVYILKEESMQELLEEGFKSLNIPISSISTNNNCTLPINNSTNDHQILTIAELEESLRKFTKRQSPTFNMSPPQRNNSILNARKMSNSHQSVIHQSTTNSSSAADLTSLKRKASIDIHSELDWITKKHK